MKVLFVSSGNYGITALIKAQAQSLIELGINVSFFPIVGKGLFGYLKNIPKLRRIVRINQPDLVHAHYSLCGIVASLSTNLPVVTSLMGSDVNRSRFMRKVIALFIKHKWSKTIVKSEGMKLKLGLDGVAVIPNGVNLALFRPMDKAQCQKRLGWDPGKKHILFVSAYDPGRSEKNVDLAKLAIKACEDNSIELHVVAKVPHATMPIYLNASDLLLMTSKWEGSPNVVKEAMACNLPIVSTDVGDVKWLLGNSHSNFVCTNDPTVLAEKLRSTLSSKEMYDLRGRVKQLGLDAKAVGYRLVGLYEITQKRSK